MQEKWKSSEKQSHKEVHLVHTKSSKREDQRQTNVEVDVNACQDELKLKIETNWRYWITKRKH